MLLSLVLYLCHGIGLCLGLGLGPGPGLGLGLGIELNPIPNQNENIIGRYITGYSRFSYIVCTWFNSIHQQ